VDIFLPLGTNVKVAIGDVVKGGKTILAELTATVQVPTEEVKVKAVKAESVPVAGVATDVPVKLVEVVEEATAKKTKKA
jgi:phosphatidylserine decarboxylase